MSQRRDVSLDSGLWESALHGAHGQRLVTSVEYAIGIASGGLSNRYQLFVPDVEILVDFSGRGNSVSGAELLAKIREHVEETVLAAELVERKQSIAVAVELMKLRAQIDGALATVFAQVGDAIDAEYARNPDISDWDSAGCEVAAELGAAVRIHDHQVQRLMGNAQTLVHEFPATYQALCAGEIHEDHVKAITEHGGHLTDPRARARYEEVVLPHARSQTRRKVVTVARRTAEQLTSRPIEVRHAQANQERHLRLIDLEDGMAQVSVVLPAELAYGIYNRVTTMAQIIKRGDRKELRHLADSMGLDAKSRAAWLADAYSNARKIDNLRADLVADMLLTASPTAHDGDEACGLGSIQAQVQITIPVLRLLTDQQLGALRAHNPALAQLPGLDGPAILTGYGPIPVETAKSLAGNSPGWDRILLEPVKAIVLHTDRYRPGKELTRYLVARDLHCTFPTCTQPTSRCDIDHAVDWAHGGKTTPENLGHLCKTHHMLKHNTNWKLTRGQFGEATWTSPENRVYIQPPPSQYHYLPPPGLPDDADDQQLPPNSTSQNTTGFDSGPTDLPPF